MDDATFRNSPTYCPGNNAVVVVAVVAVDGLRIHSSVNALEQLQGLEGGRKNQRRG